MQDELRQLEEAEGTQHGDGKNTGTSKHSVGKPPATAGHVLKRTWATEKGPSGDGKPKHAGVTNKSLTVDRWLKESMREQPWHDIGGIPELPPAKGSSVTKSDTDSNGAVAGSKRRRSPKSDK